MCKAVIRSDLFFVILEWKNSVLGENNSEDLGLTLKKKLLLRKYKKIDWASLAGVKFAGTKNIQII